MLSADNIDITIRKSRRARRIRLQVDGNGKFTLVSPWLVSKRTIDVFIKSNNKWIEKQVAKIEEQKKLRPEFKYRSGDMFYYFGEKVELVVDPSECKRPTIKVREDKMIITLFKKISESDGVSAIKKTIESFYRKKAEEVIHDRLEFFNEHYGFRYNRVTMRNQKSRWGSCSRLRNLNFNWRLIMAPIEVIDYVVVHELCHLGQMNHSPKFWALVAQTLPDHKKMRKWLRENHYLLTY